MAHTMIVNKKHLFKVPLHKIVQGNKVSAGFKEI